MNQPRTRSSRKLSGLAIRWIWNHPAGYPVNLILLDLQPDLELPADYRSLWVVEERPKAIKLYSEPTHRAAWFPKTGFWVFEHRVFHPAPMICRVVQLRSWFRDQLHDHQKELLAFDPALNLEAAS